uniref:CUB domain-containing protein n=1 Tax=Ciona savignyi TaxID=51511 RepID=H2YCE4_CIOSA
TLQYFTSTNYPQNYPNNENCSWTIDATVGKQVELTILTLTTEVCCDYVEVFDGQTSVARLKGSTTNTPRYISTTGQFRVVFISDRSVTRSGFRASYIETACGKHLNSYQCPTIFHINQLSTKLPQQ